MSGHSFGYALARIKQGEKFTRRAWKLPGAWVALAGGNDAGEPRLRPFLILRTASGEVVPYTASHTDLLAEDWDVVREEEA